MPNLQPFERHAKAIADIVKIDPLTVLAIISLLVNILRLWFESRKDGVLIRAILSTYAKHVLIKRHGYLTYRVRRRLAMEITDYILTLDADELALLGNIACQTKNVEDDLASMTTSSV